MFRIAIVMILAALSALVAMPAQADLTVRLTVSDSRITHGSRVTFEGAVEQARRGSKIKLQRATDGGWRTVATRELRRGGRFSFVTTPPRGYQDYRVAMPRRLRQPRSVSRTVRVVVRWSPRLEVQAIDHTQDSRGEIASTRVSGTSAMLPRGAELVREVLQEGAWQLDATVPVDDQGDWADVFALPSGTQVRYTAPRDGPRLRTSTSSLVIEASWEPTLTVRASLDGADGSATVEGTSTDLPEGTQVRREHLEGSTWSVRGEPVAVGPDGRFSDSFSAALHTSYRYRAAEMNLRSAAVSNTFDFTQAPVTEMSVNQQGIVRFMAGQGERIIRVDLEAGQDFTFSTPRPLRADVTVTDPQGEPVLAFDSDPSQVTTQARSSGHYEFRFSAAPRTYAWDFPITISEPVTSSTSIDAAPVDARGDLPGQVVDLAFWSDGDQIVSATSEWATVISPSGEPVRSVPVIGNSVHAWFLPAESGSYTLRMSSADYDLMDQQVQLLAAHTSEADLDGQPGSVVADVPGRVSVVSIATPADVNLKVSHDGPDHIHRVLLTPDGTRLQSFTSDTSTQEGTYLYLAALRSEAPEFNVYASTPARYDLAVGETRPFDLGPAPGRLADLRISVDSGETFSIEVLDDQGDRCRGNPAITAGKELLSWHVANDGQPDVYSAASTGRLDLVERPCTPTGTFRVTRTGVVASEVSGDYVSDNGYPVTEASATVEARSPGQVMVVDYDAGDWGDNEILVNASTESFSAENVFVMGHALVAEGSITRRGSHTATGTLAAMPVPIYDIKGKRRIFVYAGPQETGRLQLDIRREDFRR